MNNLVESLKKYKNVVHNFSYLTIIQLANIVLPFLSYPYLIRVLETELWGEIIFAQTIIFYLGVFLNFGFNISGTKRISENRNSLEKLSIIVSSIYIVKTLFFVMAFCFLCLLIYFIPGLYDFEVLLLISFGILINDLLFPQWYFQGVEKMKYITIIQVSVKVLFTVAVFVFINDKSDYLYVPIFNLLGALFSGIVSIYILRVKEGIRFIVVGFSELLFSIKNSFPFFLSASFIQIYVNANRLLIGGFLGMTELAYYDLAEKILKIVKIPINMLGQSVFPMLSLKKDVKLINKFMFISLSFATFSVLMVYVFGDLVVKVLAGSEMLGAVPIINILVFSAIFVSISQFLGTNRLVVFGFSKIFSSIVASSAFIFLSTIGLLYAFDAINIVSLSLTSVFIEMIVMVIMLFYCNKKKILI